MKLKINEAQKKAKKIAEPEIRFDDPVKLLLHLESIRSSIRGIVKCVA